MENVKEHWLVYGASVYPGRDGECVMAYNSADGSEVYAPAPRWEENAISCTAITGPRKMHGLPQREVRMRAPSRVTLHLPRRRRAVDGSTAGPGGEGQNTPIENIYCMEVVRDDLFYLITGRICGTGESQTLSSGSGAARARPTSRWSGGGAGGPFL